MFRSKGETKAVFGGWKRSEAVLPTEGRLIRTFAEDGTGIRIAAAGGSAVKAVYAGRVLQVASEDNGKSTVLVQHAGRIVTIYGNVEHPSVQPNDWVEAGGRIGTVPAPIDKGGESLLYFAVKQNGKTVDPAEVVPFD
nr:peptidoglycan DD-metalloendopeptidase family protein [Cohnella sp. CFH 77786]